MSLWLTALGLIPIIGSLAAFFLKGKSGKTAGLLVALVTLALGIALAVQWKAGAGFQFVEEHEWIPAFGATYSLGLDGMGLAMVLLTVLLVPIVLLAEWYYNDLEGRWGGNVFVGLVLLLEGLSIFVFSATDVLLFYLFFEATLIPMYFLIGGFGGSRRKYAAIKFLLFSLAGGLIMLASVVGLGVAAADKGLTYRLGDLQQLALDGSTGRWLMVGFLVAFIIKAPMAPLHTWLPDTAEQSTPGTAALLIGILDKIGTFGMIRYCVGLFPEASHWVAPFMISLAVVNVVYGGLLALAQKDLMRLVAFISISHFGVMVLGIYAFTTASLSGSMFYMVNHGLSTAALCLAILYLIKRRGSSRMDAFGGVQSLAPVLSGVLLLSGLSALGLPGMSSFVSEFLVLSGSWQRHPVAAGIATFGVVLAALYILTMYQKTMTGPVTEQTEQHFTGKDLVMSEKLVIAPLIILLLLLGFWPKPALQVVEDTAQATMTVAGDVDPAPQAGKEAK